MTTKGPRLRGGDHKGSDRSKHTRSPGYQAGDNWLVCDVCGCHVYSSAAMQRWDGMVTCKQDWEPRHEQDFVRARKDRLIPQGLLRPEGEDDYTSIPGISGPDPIEPSGDVFEHDFTTQGLGPFKLTTGQGEYVEDVTGTQVYTTRGAFPGYDYSSSPEGVPTSVSYGLRLQNATYNYLPESEDISSWESVGSPITATGLPDHFGGTSGVSLALAEKTVSAVKTATDIIPGTDSPRHVGLSFYAKRPTPSATGTIYIANSDSTSYGLWGLDIAALSLEWEKIYVYHPAVTLINFFRVRHNTDILRLELYGDAGGVAVDVAHFQVERTELQGSSIQARGEVITSYVPSYGIKGFRDASSLYAAWYRSETRNDIAGQIVYCLPPGVWEYAADTNEKYFGYQNTEGSSGITVLKGGSGGSLRTATRVSTTAGGTSLSRNEHDASGAVFQSVFDFRFRKTAADGMESWLSIDGGAFDYIQNADDNNPGDILSKFLLGANRESCVANIIKIKVHTLAPSADDVLAWGGWTPPVPVITEQPVSVSISFGQDATFSLEVDHPYPEFLWGVREGADPWTDFPGIGRKSVTFDTPAVGTYEVRCLVSNAAGGTVSTVAGITLTVT